MKFDPRTLLAPLVALGVLALTLNQTMGALQSSGIVRGRQRTTTIRTEDPYARLDRALARALIQVPPDKARDPFAFVTPHPVGVAAAPSVPKPPPPPPKPVLTAIVFDADPRATLRYNNKDFSVRENSLFADFRVTSITSTQVVLERNGEAIVLTLRSKGD